MFLEYFWRGFWIIFGEVFGVSWRRILEKDSGEIFDRGVLKLRFRGCVLERVLGGVFERV